MNSLDYLIGTLYFSSGKEQYSGEGKQPSALFRVCFPTIKIIKDRGGSATIEEVEDGVAEFMKLSEDVLSIPHGETGRSEFQYKLAWVRTYLKNMELSIIASAASGR